MGDGVGVALVITLYSWIAYDRNQLGRAADLSVAAGHVWRSLGTSLEAFGPHLSAFAEEHGPPEPIPPLQIMVMLWSGSTTSTTSSISYWALAKPRRVGRTDSAPLTKRELEVAALIESGLSNREIAERLVIAKRTADGHVERILAKLGFSSRAQVAAWMARRAS